MAVARFSVLLIALALVSFLARAEEGAKPEISPELQQLIQQLDADDFADRASASAQLAKLGKEALPALEEGVQSDSPEVATRSFDLLQQLFEQGDEVSKAAAKSSLDKLARGSDRVAAQAKKMLEPKPAPMDANEIQRAGGVRILGGGAIRILAPRIVRAAPIAPVAPAIEIAPVRKGRVISTSVNSNGVRTISVDEDGNKFKVVEDPKKGIEGEYTQTKEGKEATVKFAAKDVDELKTKHPEAFKLYERFAKGGVARVDIPAGFAAGFSAAAGGYVPVAPAAPPTREAIEELLKNLEVQIAKSRKELEVAKADKIPRAEVVAAVLESYLRLRERYQEQLKELEAKQEQAPKKPAEPKEPAEIDVKNLKIEIELR